jgi:outer membrane protein OmpA-like peptidoglycan-associated protein
MTAGGARSFPSRGADCALALVASGLVLLAAGRLRAEEENQLPVTVDVPSALVVGEARPYVTLSAVRTIKSVHVTVSRNGRRHVFSASSIGAGSSKTFTWDEPAGIYGYTVTVQAKCGSVTSRQDFTFGLSYLPPIEMTLAESQVSLSDRRLTFQLNHPAERAEISIRAPSGAEIAQATTRFDDAPPGTPLTISWPPVQGAIGSIEVTAYGTAGYWAGKVVTPWSVTIPHEDVEFETDRWEIRASETQKLDDSIELIAKALREHGSKMPVDLYVGGFTDTVGSVQHNRELSQKRAWAIAQYFQGHGVRVPIHYRGFGEEALAVATPDERAEAHNRRATYILAAEPPTLSSAVTWGGWQSLRGPR